MQDIRLRTGAGILLSLTAFTSLAGAAAVLAWWLVFTSGIGLLRNNHLVLSSLAVIGGFGIILQVTGGDGPGYVFRMMIVILVGAWLLAEQKRGEFLHLGTWLLGPRSGFELGMIAEMALQNLNGLMSDFERIRIAERFKGVRSGHKAFIAAGRVLVHNTLLRAEDTAELLAIRGYTCGGTFVPEFPRRRMDFIACLFAICAAIIGTLPVSAFFILS
ncbi:MAG: hypothetical protein GYA23_10405 [Methanomicrobiales archaeon]|nr:hypothetical protein [Methanomicrobiales archaeon]